jgi:hypothetical protein
MRRLLSIIALFLAMPALATTPPTLGQWVDQGGITRQTQGFTCLNADNTACTTSGGSSTPTGAAGSPNANVVTVQGITSGTPINTVLGAGTATIGAITNTAFGISGTLPSFASTQTFNLGTLNGAATAANQVSMNTNLTTLSGQLPASLGAKTSANSLSIAPATDATFNVFGGIYNTALTAQTAGVPLAAQLDAYGNARSTLVGVLTTGVDSFSNASLMSVLSQNSPSASTGALRTVGYVYGNGAWDRTRSLTAVDSVTGLGVSATGIVPTSAAAQALAYVTTAGAASNVLKASAGNVYGFNLVNNTTAVFAILYDATAAPTSGTALTTANIKYCFPVAASAGFDKVFNPPVRVTTGATLLTSTSCTTYTTPATLPVVLIGEAQ